MLAGTVASARAASTPSPKCGRRRAHRGGSPHATRSRLYSSVARGRFAPPEVARCPARAASRWTVKRRYSLRCHRCARGRRETTVARLDRPTYRGLITSTRPSPLTAVARSWSLTMSWHQRPGQRSLERSRRLRSPCHRASPRPQNGMRRRAERTGTKTCQPAPPNRRSLPALRRDASAWHAPGGLTHPVGIRRCHRRLVTTRSLPKPSTLHAWPAKGPFVREGGID